MSATRPPSPAAASSTSAPPLAKRPVPVIFERGAPGRVGYSLPPSDVPDVAMDAIIPSRHRRARPAALPEVSELDVVRHYTALSHRNYSIDEGFYPLGSCTMKYNPKINEDAARQAGFARLHPYQPEELAQGALQLLWELEHDLAQISGMDRVTFQPSAGAHGELAALLMISKYFAERGEPRTTVVVPDSAHGTNPASAAMAGYEVVEVKSDRRGNIDLEALRAALGPHVAALMLTNPNTLGLFEEQILDVARAVHSVGAQLYLDGANFNAILGITRPGDQGFDVMHFNLHKTFTTPHGGGGPGAGAVGVRAHLVPYLPVPTVERDGRRFALDYNRPKTIGKVRAFYGNFGNLVRAYTYIRTMGPAGLRAAAETAVLNANYVLSRLRALRPAVRPDLQARVRPLRPPAARPPPRLHQRYGQAPPRLRLPLADDLLPADRRRSHHDRADRDREPPDPRRLRRRHDRHRAGGRDGPGDRPDRAPRDAGHAAG